MKNAHQFSHIYYSCSRVNVKLDVCIAVGQFDANRFGFRVDFVRTIKRYTVLQNENTEKNEAIVIVSVPVILSTHEVKCTEQTHTEL